MNPKQASTRAIERAAKSIRATDPKRDHRGRRLDEASRVLGVKLEKKLQALGVRVARVTVTAGAPGKPANVRIDRIPIDKLAEIAKALTQVARQG
ncbi:hypothetical protein BH09MYX1_BH09MYX1_52490 [soil metagenome]